MGRAQGAATVVLCAAITLLITWCVWLLIPWYLWLATKLAYLCLAIYFFLLLFKELEGRIGAKGLEGQIGVCAFLAVLAALLLIFIFIT